MALVEFEAEVLASSPEALLCQIEDQQVWIPRSQIDAENSEIDPWKGDTGDSGVIHIPEWIALNEGLI